MYTHCIEPDNLLLNWRLSFTLESKWQTIFALRQSKHAQNASSEFFSGNELENKLNLPQLLQSLYLIPKHCFSYLNKFKNKKIVQALRKQHFRLLIQAICSSTQTPIWTWTHESDSWLWQGRPDWQTRLKENIEFFVTSMILFKAKLFSGTVPQLPTKNEFYHNCNTWVTKSQSKETVTPKPSKFLILDKCFQLRLLCSM